MMVKYEDVKQDLDRYKEEVANLKQQLYLIANFHIESHEDAIEMRNIAKEALNI